MRFLPVDAHDLLMPGQNPRLYGRRPFPCLDQAVDAHPELAEPLSELPSCIIIAHAPDHVAPGAERNDIGRYVGGAAHARPFLFHLNDGYGRLR